MLSRRAWSPSAISTAFCRAAAPLTTVKRPAATFQRLAKSLITAAFALPPSADAVTVTESEGAAFGVDFGSGHLVALALLA